MSTPAAIRITDKQTGAVLQLGRTHDGYIEAVGIDLYPALARAEAYSGWYKAYDIANCLLSHYYRYPEELNPASVERKNIYSLESPELVSPEIQYFYHIEIDSGRVTVRVSEGGYQKPLNPGHALVLNQGEPLSPEEFRELTNSRLKEMNIRIRSRNRDWGTDIDEVPLLSPLEEPMRL